MQQRYELEKQFRVFLYLVYMFVFLLASPGCQPQPKPKDHFYYVDADQAKHEAKGQNFEDPSKIEPLAAIPKNLNTLIAEQKRAAVALKKYPHNPQVKKEFIKASDVLALNYQLSPKISRKIKYRKALELYRQVLRISPNDYDAKNDSALIISIYRELHIPVPVN